MGRTGRGKTTLLRLLRGEYPYSGTITADMAFGYFPYPVEDPAAMTLDVLSAICPAAEWELLLEARPSMAFVEYDAAFRERIAARLCRLEKAAL